MTYAEGCQAPEYQQWLRARWDKWQAEIDARDRWRLERVRLPILGQYPPDVAAHLAAGHTRAFETAEEGQQPGAVSRLGAANGWLKEKHRQLKAAHLTRAYDEDAIRDYAENYSSLAARCGTLAGKIAFAEGRGVKIPEGREITEEGIAARLECPRWWRRQLRKGWTRAAENGMRDIGMIRKGRQPYASDEAVKHRRQQRRRQREFLESHVMENEQGEQLELLKLADRSIANPAIRRGEFMCRMRGFEEIARDLGHVAVFVTLTAPSAFHAQLASAGRNPAFDRRNIVREAQRWLCKMWARARAKLKRLSIFFYGFRIAEPHHDATPHWHLLLFLPGGSLITLRAVLRAVWLSDYAEEPGAREHRCKFEQIDATKGSATGYITKYVSKNIDGAGVISEQEDIETGVSVASGIVRVDAWASVHGIRQFQQVGGAPVGLWREARRIRAPVADADIERARAAADAGRWADFWRAVTCGKATNGRKTEIKIEKEITGECNRYGELSAPQIVGIRSGDHVERTRQHVWRIEKKRCGLPQGAVSVLKAKATEETGTESYRGNRHGPACCPVLLLPWTCSNNCTRAVGPLCVDLHRPVTGAAAGCS